MNYNNIMIKMKDSNQNFLDDFIDRIKATLNGEDFIAQITKNNIVIGVASYANREEIEHFLKEFFSQNKKPINLEGNELFFDIKAGISMYPENGTTSNEFIINAYIALENVINVKEIKYKYYEPVLKDNIEKEIRMNLFLRKAISNNELSVYYQPQVEIEKEKTVGAEALLRWNNKQLGIISPGEFIPLAEKQVKLLNWDIG